MKFSIVIPAYNRADFLPRTLKSVFNQTYRAHEIIVVNDGSTDNSEVVISELMKSHTNLRLINENNGERGKARNVGWSESTGDYVVFFDSDDQMLPHYLETLKSGIESHSNPPDLVACKFQFERNGTFRKHLSQEGLKGEHDYKLFLEGNPLACHFAVRREASLKPFEEDRNLATLEDWLFLLENTTSRKILILDSVAISMTEHSGRSMHDNETLIEKRLKAAVIILSRLNLSDSERKAVKAYSHLFCLVHAVDGKLRLTAIHHLGKCLKYGLMNRIVAYSMFRLVFGNRVTRCLSRFLIWNQSK